MFSEPLKSICAGFVDVPSIGTSDDRKQKQRLCIVERASQLFKLCD